MRSATEENKANMDDGECGDVAILGRKSGVKRKTAVQLKGGGKWRQREKQTALHL